MQRPRLNPTQALLWRGQFQPLRRLTGSIDAGRAADALLRVLLWLTTEFLSTAIGSSG